jgi:hypothetical protein
LILRDAATINFSQDSIGYTFQESRFGNIDELAVALRSGKIKPTEIKPIRLVDMDGILVSIDNRRLEAFRRAGVPIQTRLATAEEIEEAIAVGKFSAGPRGGFTTRVRRGK